MKRLLSSRSGQTGTNVLIIVIVLAVIVVGALALQRAKQGVITKEKQEQAEWSEKIKGGLESYIAAQNWPLRVDAANQDFARLILMEDREPEALREMGAALLEAYKDSNSQSKYMTLQIYSTEKLVVQAVFGSEAGKDSVQVFE